ncbi:MAG: ROK family protein, partial [Clostridia bacterium]|nr:ROK family protein [Clostridia bacterium]
MKKEFYCAVDIGGTKILLFLIDNKGQVVFREKIATPKPEHPEIIVEKVVLLLKKALITLNLNETELRSGVGICIAGFVDHHCGVVHQSPNLHWHNPVPLRDLMKEALACPVLLENDANAAVLGEVY